MRWSEGSEVQWRDESPLKHTDHIAKTYSAAHPSHAASQFKSPTSFQNMAVIPSSAWTAPLVWGKALVAEPNAAFLRCGSAASRLLELFREFPGNMMLVLVARLMFFAGMGMDWLSYPF